eukprot:2369503-Prymnesium_polylepis.1
MTGALARSAGASPFDMLKTDDESGMCVGSRWEPSADAGVSWWMIGLPAERNAIDHSASSIATELLGKRLSGSPSV